MTNKEVAKSFNLLGKVMELHGENPFKTRSYYSAYNTIRRLPEEVAAMSKEQLLTINGIGKNIADKIIELSETGHMSTLEKYLDQTPAGVVDMLSIKGFGPKKVGSIWRELEIETPGELLYACEENRLVDLKGFGQKTQQDLKNKLIYFLDAQGKYLYGHIIPEAEELLEILRSEFPNDRFEFINDVRRALQIVEQIDIIGTISADDVMIVLESAEGFIPGERNTFKGSFMGYEEVPPNDFDVVHFEGSASSEFLDAWDEILPQLDTNQPEEQIFESIQFIPAESRESRLALELAIDNQLNIIEEEDIKGVVHCHTTYSDGVNSLQEMALTAKQMGYDYIVITDHSKSAFYANGLKEDRVIQQFDEIDKLNTQFEGFRIYKGIESDILNDGRLDYEEDLLEQFDLIIASVHSNLRMDETKATQRLITAISNPNTRILGHPTGRLLLSREGYPIDHMAVIDACAEYNVSIELNANPYRLDLDWTWIPYAMEKNVLISINPDAHSINGIKDIAYGVIAARKALLTPEHCLNALSLEEFGKWINNP